MIFNFLYKQIDSSNLKCKYNTSSINNPIDFVNRKKSSNLTLEEANKHQKVIDNKIKVIDNPTSA